MPVSEITLTSSFTRLYRHETNRVISTADLNTMGGSSLSGSIMESLLLAARAIQNELGSNNVYLGFKITSWNGTTIVTGPGVIVTPTAIHYLEGLTLTPTAAAYWGFYELELVEENSDAVGKDFVNPMTEVISNASSDTRKKFRVRCFENYNTLASFPSVSAGRIKWLEYKKQASLQPIVSVSGKLRAFQPTRGTLSVPNNGTGTLESVFGEQIGGRYEVMVDANQLIECLVHWDGTNLRVVTSSPQVTTTQGNTGTLNVYISSGLVTFENKLGANVVLVLWRKF